MRAVGLGFTAMFFLPRVLGDWERGVTRSGETHYGKRGCGAGVNVRTASSARSPGQSLGRWVGETPPPGVHR